MARALVPEWFARRFDRRRLLAPLLVVTFLLAHQLLMATEGHATDMLRDDSLSGLWSAWAGAGTAVIVGAREAPGDRLPIPGWADCLAGNALLPSLLLFLGLVGIGQLAFMAPVPMSPPVRPAARRFLHPPPKPSRRQALLHIFRN